MSYIYIYIYETIILILTINSLHFDQFLKKQDFLSHFVSQVDVAWFNKNQDIETKKLWTDSSFWYIKNYSPKTNKDLLEVAFAKL